MQKIRIDTNPYLAQVSIRLFDDKEQQWCLPCNSEFEKFEGKECVFAFCVEEILQIISEYWNRISTLLFVGTVKDFELLKEKAKEYDLSSIDIVHEKSFSSADEAIQDINKAYDHISKEFADCKNEEIIKTIEQYNDTVSTKIPLCVIGTYSAGKSTFINALIGREILPTGYEPSTAVNVEVRNVENRYCTKFMFHGKETTIDFLKKKIHPNYLKLEDVAEAKGIFNEADPATGIYRFLEYLNSEESKALFHGEQLVSLELHVPFKDSNLDDSQDIHYSIYDTPGSNNAANESHKKYLEDVLRKQTNALPIVITDKGQQASDDTSSLLDLLSNHHEDFSIPYTLIVMSQADKMTPNEMEAGISEVFRNKFFNPSVFYVSALQCLAAKKEDTSEKGWIDKNAFQNYDQHIAGRKHIDCHEYNHSVFSESNYPSDIVESGIPDVEEAINNFARNYARYKKCVNGRKFLLDAIGQISVILNDKKRVLENLLDEKRNEQTEKKNQIMDELKNVPLPNVPLVFKKVNREFIPQKKAYAASVRDTLSSLLDLHKGEKNLAETIRKAMTQDCQEKLFDAAYPGIQASAKSILSDELSNYRTAILKIVAGNEKILSKDARVEIVSIVSEGEKPEFKSKKITFRGVGFLAVMGSFKHERLREAWINSAAKKFTKHVCGDGKKGIGDFSHSCIYDPLNQYCKGLDSWKNKYIDDVEKTLNQDNAILTQFEAEIQTLIGEIKDLEGRLQNIQDSKELLDTLLLSQSL